MAPVIESAGVRLLIVLRLGDIGGEGRSGSQKMI